MGCLYRVTSPSGKSYIGITHHTVENRWKRHTYVASYPSSKKAISCAIRKYGEENFKIETLVISNDYEYLKILEKRAIKIFNTLVPNGYNLTEGGDGSVGFRFSKEQLERLRISHLGQVSWLKGKHWSPEMRKKLSESHKGQVPPNTGKKWSEEIKAKMAVAQKKRFNNPDYIHPMKGKSHTEETKKKLSEAARERARNKPPKRGSNKNSKNQNKSK